MQRLQLNKLYICIVFAFLLIPASLFATHNKAGEITYVHLSGYEYLVRIITYTNIKQTPQSQPPDRDKLEIFWGDGESDTISRVNNSGGGDTIAVNTKKNIYEGRHNYQGAGTYIIFFSDQNRNDDVDNMQNSVTQAFFVQTKLVINNGTPGNNSPILLQPPIDQGTFNQVFIHNPNAYDIDGDSLSYELTECKGLGGGVCQGYFFPAGPDYNGSKISIDASTGDFIWDTPQDNSNFNGDRLFNYAIIIKEWRRLPNGNIINIGYVTRDFQVEIVPSTNHPPYIIASDTCVEAGTLLLFDVWAYEPDHENVTIEATGEPFVLSVSPATYDTDSTTNLDSVAYNFSWNTHCAHVRKNPYQVVFKATDDNSQVELVDLQTIKITVVGPSPKNPLAAVLVDAITLSWDANTCTNASGYHIYRRVNKANFIPGYCETGVPSYTGYSRIASNTGVSNITYNDSQGLSPAVSYCYIITSYFEDGAEGYASAEVCERLRRHLPVITNVDVELTDVSNGSIYIAWSPPVDIDTILYPPPYSYKLQRADANSTIFTDVAVLNNWIDTIYTETGLNTFSTQYKYRVEFYYSNNIYLGSSPEATSIYLTVLPGDNKARLSWNFNVPWSNNKYYIYRKTGLTAFAMIDSSSQPLYTDYTVLNDTNYCYYIEAYGSYGDPGIIDPIINKSQEACVIPFDNEAPCTAILSATANCDSSTVEFSWTFNVISDCKSSDIDYFTVYYAETSSDLFDSVGTFTVGLTNYSFDRNINIGGCYYITATDTNGNVSDSSNSVCIETCPIYELPNVFSPDGNGINDLFTPIEQLGSGLFFRDIRDVAIKIYNRWGAIVFETDDPVIKWNGKRHNDGADVPEGTYFYTCIVNVIGQAEDDIPIKLHGAIHLFRSGAAKENN